MAEFAVDVAKFNHLLQELWICLNDLSEIKLETDVLDCLIEDQFDEPERNEIGREFVISAYKGSVIQKTTELEENLQSLLGQLKKLQASQCGCKTDESYLLSMSALYPVGLRADF